MDKEEGKAIDETKVARKTDDLRAALIKEATTLGIPLPKLSVAGIKDKKNIDKETARQKVQFNHILQDAIDKHKANAKMKPIDKRRELLKSRFKAVKSQTRAVTYSDANIKAWLEEDKMIRDNPKSWVKVTKNGTIPFTPANKRKKTAKEILDTMDLE